MTACHSVQEHFRPLPLTSDTAKYEVRTFNRPPVVSHRPCCYSCQGSCFAASGRTRSRPAAAAPLRSRFVPCYHSSASCLTSACSGRSPSDVCFKWCCLGHFQSSSHSLIVESFGSKTAHYWVPWQHFAALSFHLTYFATCSACSISYS